MAAVAFTDSESRIANDDTIKLFNGENLDGWHMDVPALDDNAEGDKPFIVRDGKLVSLGTPRGHLITDEKFENYRLTVETSHNSSLHPVALPVAVLSP